MRLHVARLLGAVSWTHSEYVIFRFSPFLFYIFRFIPLLIYSYFFFQPFSLLILCFFSTKNIHRSIGSKEKKKKRNKEKKKKRKAKKKAQKKSESSKGKSQQFLILKKIPSMNE